MAYMSQEGYDKLVAELRSQPEIGQNQHQDAHRTRHSEPQSGRHGGSFYPTWHHQIAHR